MTLFFLLFTHVFFIGWAIGMSQRMQQETPWWGRRFRIACIPMTEAPIFWLTRIRRGFTWEIAEMRSHTFALWKLPSAVFMALRLGARWRELWIRWV